ncbi:hypothetical protein [Tessaracoccus massiliensis]|uniref:hypothetical protein n=1 Tax=Tessaracoccus massiliensis TaxID=1522311 RepID=UPI00058CCE97|nr:hypothetical protein [Tessaracoccus massiliensis]
MKMKWHPMAPLSGPASRTVLGLILIAGFGWLTWPIWSSFTAPDRQNLAALRPALFSALAGLVVLLGWAIWRDAGHQMRQLATIVTLATVAAGFRMLVQPGASGIEPVFAFPLLAGVALGSPAGFLTGALACLGSSAAMGLLADPLIGQCLVWGLWGAAGGLLRPLGGRSAWVGALAMSLPLGVITGLALNLIGWSGERTAEVGAFLPGVGWWEAAQRLWAYTRATSITFDLVRTASTATLIAFIGLPLIRALRTAVAPDIPAHPTEVIARPPEITHESLQRRERSAHLATLWHRPEGESDA